LPLAKGFARKSLAFRTSIARNVVALGRDRIAPSLWTGFLRRHTRPGRVPTHRSDYWRPLEQIESVLERGVGEPRE
jgi:hypothetical protein